MTTSIALPTYTGELTRQVEAFAALGRQEAIENRPPSDALQMDQHEVLLRSGAEKLAAEAHQRFLAVLTETSRASHELEERIPDLEGRIQRALSDTALRAEAKADLASNKSPLITATVARKLAEVEFKSFRHENGIRQQAKYPENRVWHVAIILALALGETVMNAFFFENAQGLLGGFIVALGVAGLNMGSAFGLGSLFRFKNLPDPGARILGWLSGGSFVVLTLFFNTLFAAFRTAYEAIADPTDVALLRGAFREAVDAAGGIFVFDGPFQDLTSLILFGIGIILSGVAFYKGMNIDDRYPGHGRRDRDVKTALAAEGAERERVRQHLKLFLQAKRDELQRLLTEPTQIISIVAAKASALQHAGFLHDREQGEIQRDFALVLTTYRDANASIRPTKPPSYFAAVPEISRATEPNVVNGVLGHMGLIRDRAQALRERFTDGINARLNQLQHDVSGLLDAGFDEFVKAVDLEAEVEINRRSATIERASSDWRIDVAR